MTGVSPVVGEESDRHLDLILFFGWITRYGRRGMATHISERVDGFMVKVVLCKY